MPGTEAISVNLPKRSHGLLHGINGLSFTQSPDLSIPASQHPSIADLVEQPGASRAAQGLLFQTTFSLHSLQKQS